MRKALVFTLLPVLLFAAGCGKSKDPDQAAAERVIEQAAKANGQNVDVDLSKGAMTITDTKSGETTTMNMSEGGSDMTIAGKDGETRILSGKSAKLPDNFPKDVPVYPGAELQSVMTDAGEASFTYMGTSKDDVAKAGEWYKRELAKGGWTEEVDNQMAGDQPMRMLSFGKDDRQVMVMIHKEGENTFISCQQGKK